MSKRKIEESSRPIGVFDSGVGGLTVVKELQKILPNERIIYFGDTARVPYGNKSRETIIAYSLQIAYFLLRKKIKMLVVACNSVSSVALPTLKRHFHIPIVGVIEPGVKAAVDSTSSNRILVTGTLGTIISNSYKKLILKLNNKLKVYQKACPLFVPLAEDGWCNNKIAQSVADEYLKEYSDKYIDTLILGCTHYPLLKKVIQKSAGRNVKLIDSGKETAKVVKKILEKRQLLNLHKLSEREHSMFYVSDFPHRFKEVSKLFMDEELKYVHKIKLNLLNN